jgi:hypothetical protein
MKTRLGVAFILVSALISMAAVEEDQAKPSYWMQKKLHYSENILQGLVNKDFEQIEKNARSMAALNQIEKWVHGGTPDYRAQLHLFQHANEQLVRAAGQQNLDGAALAYVQLSLSCIHCHKVVRDVQPKAQTPAK